HTNGAPERCLRRGDRKQPVRGAQGRSRAGLVRAARKATGGSDATHGSRRTGDCAGWNGMPTRKNGFWGMLIGLACVLALYVAAPLLGSKRAETVYVLLVIV